MAVSAVRCLVIASSKTSVYRISLVVRKGAMRRDQIGGAMSLMGQKRKYSIRAENVRFTSESGNTRYTNKCLHWM